VYRGHFGNIITFMVAMWVVSWIIVLLAGATNLSRANERNVLPPESV
jgi:hypothetical protein